MCACLIKVNEERSMHLISMQLKHLLTGVLRIPSGLVQLYRVRVTLISFCVGLHNVDRVARLGHD